MLPEQEMQAWRHWHEACALGLISETGRMQLRRVIADRFRSMLRKINLHGQGMLSAPPEADCAHLFESYCAVHQRRDGKKYKDWLLTRGRRDLDTVQSGVMLLVRNVVREWIRDVHPKTAALSLQQCLGDHGVSLQELLPDQKTPARSEDQTLWMAAYLAEARADLEAVEITVLKLRAQDVIFSAPGIQETYGVGKSTLHKYHRRLLTRIAEAAVARFPELSPEDGVRLVLDILDALAQDIFLNFSAEKPGTAAFRKVKESHDPE
jgi:hypothetical protein